MRRRVRPPVADFPDPFALPVDDGYLADAKNGPADELLVCQTGEDRTIDASPFRDGDGSL